MVEWDCWEWHRIASINFPPWILELSEVQNASHCQLSTSPFWSLLVLQLVIQEAHDNDVARQQQELS